MPSPAIELTTVQLTKAPDHQHLAVGEVDQVDDAVDHRVAQGHKCVHAAKHQTVDDLLEKGFRWKENSCVYACFEVRARGPLLQRSRRV